MLEPVVRPPVGKALNGLAAVGAIGLTFWDAGVTTPSAFIPGWVLFPLVATAFALRFVGISAGEWRKLTEMPWGYRFASWGVLTLLFALVGALGSRYGWLTLAAFCALDAAGALAPVRPRNDAKWWSRVRFPDLKGHRAWALAIAGYLALVALVHALWARTVAYGPLVDWTALVMGFALLVRLAAPGARVSEPAARPPPAHRKHAREDKPVPDPGMADVTAACRALAEDGDAEGLVALVARSAAFGDVPPAVARDAEARVLAALGRAGTTREDDIDAALAALEAAFTDASRSTRTVTT